MRVRQVPPGKGIPGGGGSKTKVPPWGGGYRYFLELHNVTKFQKIINDVKIFTIQLQHDLTYGNSPNL